VAQRHQDIAATLHVSTNQVSPAFTNVIAG
jgi:hypothetical protein